MVNNTKKTLFVYGPVTQKDIDAAIVSRGIDIVYFYNSGTVDRERLRTHFGSSLEIRIITRNDFNIVDLLAVRGSAFTYIDQVYGYLDKQKLIPAKWAIEAYNDNRITLIFKKQIIELLAEWLIAEHLSEKLLGTASNIFILAKSDVAEIGTIYRKLFDNQQSIIINGSFISRLKNSIKNSCLFLMVPFYALISVRRLRFDGGPLATADLAIRLHANIRRASDKLNPNGYDALEDYTKDNTSIIYVAEQELNSRSKLDILTKSQTALLLGRGGFDSITGKFLVFLLKTQIAAILNVVPLFCRSSSVFYSILPKISFELLRWSNFGQNYRIGWYITFNNAGKSHITRNLILERYGIRTFSYEVSFTNKYFLDSNKFNGLLNPARAYSIYDTRAYILRAQYQFDILHGADMRHHLTTGPLDYPKGELSLGTLDTLKNPLFHFIECHDKKVISLFTTSMGQQTMNGENELIKFFDVVNNLVTDNRFKDFVFVLKLKNTIQSNNATSSVLLEKYKKFVLSKRTFVIDMNISASLVIHLSDFVLSMAFTSPTLEALAMRKPAGFIIEKNQFPQNIFKEKSKLMNTTSNQIWRNWDYFSNLSEIEFDHYYHACVDSGYERSNGSVSPRKSEEPGYKIIANHLT